MIHIYTVSNIYCIAGAANIGYDLAQPKQKKVMGFNGYIWVAVYNI